MVRSSCMNKQSNKKQSNDYFLSDEDFDGLDFRSLVEEYIILRKKYVKLINKLQDRVELERAKDVLMECMKCSGHDAMFYLQKLSSNNNITIEEASKQVIHLMGTLINFKKVHEERK